MEKCKPKILVLLECYLPGYKYGGPVRTIANTVEALGDYFQFYIVTMDRDSGETIPYADIKRTQWNNVGKAMVYYLSPDEQSFRNMVNLMNSVYADILYLNSFFSPRFSLFSVWANNSNKIKTNLLLLAPRGEFSAGAISIKSWKKKPFVFISSLLGTHKRLYWHASTDYEKQDIIREMKINVSRIFIAQNIPTVIKNDDNLYRYRSINEPLRVVFLSRVSRKKNIHFALEVLRKVSVPVHFDIFGPLEDKEYWSLCECITRKLPDHISASYKGGVTPVNVQQTLSKYDLFFFPTLGENYGHVIAESLCAGTPVLISDLTPWKNLPDKGFGWDISLDSVDKFIECIEEISGLKENEMILFRKRIIESIKNELFNDTIIQANKQMFEQCLNCAR